MKNYIYSKVAILIATFFLFAFSHVFAQKHEYGFMVSNGFYKGSLSRTPTFLDVNPSFTGFYRYNINPAVVFRSQLTYLSLKYDDLNWENPISNARKTSFSTDIVELGFLGEYNFFDYRGKNERVTWAPYLVGGAASFIATNADESIAPAFNFAMPIGFGLKFNLGKQWNIGTEFLARKTFSDQIDGVSGMNFVNNTQAGDLNKTDWYYSIGIFISYTKYSVECANLSR